MVFRSSGIELNSVFKEIHELKKWNKKNGSLRARSHPAKFLTCEKELKKNFKLGVVGHTLIPALGKQRMVDL